MDVRAKQRLSYRVVFLTRSCVDSVSPHVISAVGRLFFIVGEKKMNQIPNCSFCGKSESEVGGFLPGMVDGSICFDCIERSSLLPVNTDATASCNFCGRKQGEVPKLLMGKKANICNTCVDIMLQPPSVFTRSGFVINPNTRFGSWLLNSKNRFIRKYVVGSEP